jgi:hypothetical protein
MEYFIYLFIYFAKWKKNCHQKKPLHAQIIFKKRKNNLRINEKNLCSKIANGASSVAQDNECLDFKDYNIVPTKLVNVFYYDKILEKNLLSPLISFFLLGMCLQ